MLLCKCIIFTLKSYTMNILIARMKSVHKNMIIKYNT